MPHMCHDFVIYKKQAAMWFPVSSSSLQSHGLVASRLKFFIPSQEIKNKKRKETGLKLLCVVVFFNCSLAG